MLYVSCRQAKLQQLPAKYCKCRNFRWGLIFVAKYLHKNYTHKNLYTQRINNRNYVDCSYPRKLIPSKICTITVSHFHQTTSSRQLQHNQKFPGVSLQQKANTLQKLARKFAYQQCKLPQLYYQEPRPNKTDQCSRQITTLHILNS